MSEGCNNLTFYSVYQVNKGNLDANFISIAYFKDTLQDGFKVRFVTKSIKYMAAGTNHDLQFERGLIEILIYLSKIFK